MTATLSEVPIRLSLSLAALSVAVLLASCGGGDPAVPGTGSTAGAPTTKGAFSAVVSFGDSLSDAGTYEMATSISKDGKPPFLGGRFTTNGPGGTVWVEKLAAALNIPISVAEYGFGAVSVKCPAANANCTAYGQGGSRVTDPNGNNHDQGLLTVPVVTQIANHLQAFGGFKPSDLVLVHVGNNDVFVQFSAFVDAATRIQTDAATGVITPDEAQRRLFAAQTAAQGEMKKAALELSSYVTSQILAKGGRYVAVMALTDIADTPFGAGLPSNSLRSVLSDLSSIFNLWLREGLVGQPVQIIDTWALFKNLHANATTLGFTNFTDMACDPVKTNETSLLCNATPGSPLNNLVPNASATTWFFADSVHPTTGGHQAISDAVAALLRGYGWI